VFSDRVRVVVRSGRGGDGALSFRREKYVPRGGPDGGDGGRGGDVVLVADARLRDLSSLRGRAVLAAERGAHGRGSRKDGADGAAIEVAVPVGTQVTGEEGALVADLARPGSRAVVARGGEGGRGNARFATPTRQAPRFAETGLPGVERELHLQLKLVADAALAGLPNAGKSSLLRRISNATPKVADYPFTTLQPVLGTVEGPDGAQLTVADVPGLIEGASEGVGLGHAFLAHLERARLLVHVIDGSEGDADARFATIDRELGLYGAGLGERPQIVVLNKADLSPEPAPFSVDDPRILAVHRVSCASGAGISELKQALLALCPAAPEPVDEDEPELPEFLDYRPRPRERRTFRVLRTDRGFRVVGQVPEGEELERALRAAGVRRGALVEVGDEELEWQPPERGAP
jgi:GTP-binding protein